MTAIMTGRKQAGVYAHDVYLKYKDHRIFGVYLLFKPILVTADPNIIQIILTKKFESFHDRGLYINEKINPLFDNLVFINGKKWKSLRQKLRHTFTTENLKQMFDIVKECGEELTKFLETKAKMRESVEMKDMFARYTIDVIMSTTFGIQSNCIKEPNNEYRIQGKNILRIKIIRFILSISIPKIMDFFSIPLTDRSITSFYTNIFRETVEYRQAHKVIKKDFMDLLIQLMEKGHVDDDKKTDVTSTINKFTMKEAIAQSFIFFLAGFETSAATATFALYELAHNPDIQDKVHKEIDKVLAKHNDGLTCKAIKEMENLEKVIDETLRKYPPLPMLNRICTKDITLSSTTDIHLPKGTSILIPILGLHRDPSIYPDPDKFNPDRFNLDEKARRHGYSYLPFGQGPRICIGAKFGKMQTKVGLVSLLSKYKFKPHSQTAVPFIFNEKSFGLAVKGGIHLIIEQR
ncbi:probable cytochrome P450 6a23 [Temnothorax longispinosus]|uniref:probable cytochrome P450 6a23 n=1 Tax=Temnothorax longispinosus TaxID=300112 RepID=UPI003A99DC50